MKKYEELLSMMSIEELAWAMIGSIKLNDREFADACREEIKETI